MQELEAHLSQHTSLYVKDIVAYVEITFGVKYTIHGLRDWLKRQQFSYKKPAVVPGKANEQQQKDWIAAYEKLGANLPANETMIKFTYFAITLDIIKIRMFITT